jgi:hypothetical protein
VDDKGNIAGGRDAVFQEGEAAEPSRTIVTSSKRETAEGTYEAEGLDHQLQARMMSGASAELISLDYGWENLLFHVRRKILDTGPGPGEEQVSKK